jgi:hypothetical protein
MIGRAIRGHAKGFTLALAFGIGASTWWAQPAPAGVVLQHPNPKVAKAFKEAQPFLERHTGLEFQEQVKVRILSRETFKAESDRECEKDREAIRKQLAVPVILGLIASVDSGEAQLKSLISGASTGSYSIEAREMRLPDDSDIDMITFVHEMQHALIDQNFGLAKIRGSARGDGDMGTAINAVIEGSAKLAEATYDEWSETRDPAKAVPSKALLEKIKRSALNEVRKLYAGKTVADPSFTVNADVYLAYTFGQAYLANRAILEADRGWHGWYKTLFADGLPASSREILELGMGERFARERLELDLAEFRDRLAGMPEWKLVNDTDDDRFGELYGRLYLRRPIDAPRAGVGDSGLGWTGDRMIAVQSSKGDVGFGGAAALVMAFGGDADAIEAIKQFGRAVVPGRDLGRMATRVGRVVVFRVGEMPEPLFRAITRAVAARPMPELPPTPALLARMGARCRMDPGGWAEVERLLPEVQGDRSEFLEGLANWAFLERTAPALREPFDRSIDAGARLASPEFRGRLQPLERLGLIRVAMEALDDPDVAPACRFNALRLVVAEFPNISNLRKSKVIDAAEKLGPRGREIADVLRRADLRSPKGK